MKGVRVIANVCPFFKTARKTFSLLFKSNANCSLHIRSLMNKLVWSNRGNVTNGRKLNHRGSNLSHLKEYEILLGIKM
jgi:hypothetical protein